MLATYGYSDKPQTPGNAEIDEIMQLVCILAEFDLQIDYESPYADGSLCVE